MKKNLLNLLSCAAVSLLFLTGCNLEIVDDTYRTAPNVQVQVKSVVLAFPKISDNTKSITVYRFDGTTKGTPSNTETGVNIGIIYPEAYGNEDAYSYVDAYGKTGNKYYYRVRYYTSETDYAYSKWSAEIEFKEGYGIDYDLRLRDNTITFNEKDKSLVLSSDITWNDKSLANSDYKTFDTTFYIALTCTDASTQDPIGTIIAPLTSAQAKQEIIPVRTIIPSNFYENDIKILGLLALRKEIVEEPKSDKKTSDTTTKAETNSNDGSKETVSDSESSSGSESTESKPVTNTETESKKEKIKQYIFTELASVGPCPTIRIPLSDNAQAIDYR